MERASAGKPLIKVPCPTIEYESRIDLGRMVVGFRVEGLGFRVVIDAGVRAAIYQESRGSDAFQASSLES